MSNCTTQRRDTTDSGSAATPDEEPCVICEMDVDGSVTQTTNRGLFQVNTKVTIEPFCDEHDDQTPAEKIRLAMQTGGVALIADCVRRGVVTVADARDELPPVHYADLRNRIDGT